MNSEKMVRSFNGSGSGGGGAPLLIFLYVPAPHNHTNNPIGKKSGLTGLRVLAKNVHVHHGH